MDLRILLFAAVLIAGVSSVDIEGMKLVGGIKFTKAGGAALEQQVNKVLQQIKQAIASHDDTVVVLSDRNKKYNIRLKGTARRNAELKRQVATSNIVGSIILDPSKGRKRNNRNIAHLFDSLDFSTGAKTLIIVDNEHIKA